MKNYSRLFYFLVVIALVSCTEMSAQVKSLPLKEFVDSYKSDSKAQLLDVRTPQEWANGKLDSSVLINYNDSDFEKNLAKLDKDKPVYVFCAVGGRSAKASAVLSKKGYKVYNLSNAGYGDLKKSGL